jgi:hypothetical protein
MYASVATSLQPHGLYVNLAVHRDYSSPGHTDYLNLAVRCDYSSSGCTGSTPPMACIQARRLAARRRLLRLAQARRRLLRLAQARRRLLRLRRVSGCLGTSRGSSRGPSCRSSSTTPRVRVPRYVTQLVASLVVNYFAFAARPGASARRATRRRLLRLAQARRRLLHRASGCLGTSHGSSCGPSCRSSSTTPRVRVPRHVARLVTRLVAPLVVDYFTFAARPDASARRAARRRLLRLAQARRRLLHRASGCLGTSRGSSRG